MVQENPYRVLPAEDVNPPEGFSNLMNGAASGQPAGVELEAVNPEGGGGEPAVPGKIVFHYCRWESGREAGDGQVRMKLTIFRGGAQSDKASFNQRV